MKRVPALAVLFVAMHCSCSDNVTVVETGKPAPPIRKIESAAALKQTMTEPGVTVVHALDVEHFQKGHVPGAVNVDYEKMTVEMLPANKAAPLVFYCAGPGCPVSKMAARKAASWGYEDVWVFEGGIKEWKAAGMDVATGP